MTTWTFVPAVAVLAARVLILIDSGKGKRPVATPWMAETLPCSVSYLENILAALREAKLIHAQRGPGGGYFLSKPLEQITFWEVFSVFTELPAPELPAGLAKVRAAAELAMQAQKLGEMVEA